MKLWECFVEIPIPSWGEITKVIVLAESKEMAEYISKEVIVFDSSEIDFEKLIIKAREIDSNTESVIAEIRNSS